MIRRWFRPRYSLATLFVIVTLFGCWLGYSMRWIRQRQEMLKNYDVIDRYESSPRVKLVSNGPTEVSAPGGLGLFGERGIAGLRIVIRDYDESREIQSYEVVERAWRLFPEAVDISFSCLSDPES